MLRKRVSLDIGEEIDLQNNGLRRFPKKVEGFKINTPTSSYIDDPLENLQDDLEQLGYDNASDDSEWEAHKIASPNSYTISGYLKYYSQELLRNLRLATKKRGYCYPTPIFTSVLLISFGVFMTTIIFPILYGKTGPILLLSLPSILPLVGGIFPFLMVLLMLVFLP